MLHLNDKFRDTRIILASASPRRRHLLQELGLSFEVYDRNSVDETYPSSLTGEKIPVYLAEKKSQALESLLDDNTLLITADTIVWCRGRVLNKPSDREDAIRILGELSGRKHKVFTGVCLRNKSKSLSFHSVTSVWFRKLSVDEIVYYIDMYKPYDKAGAYGIQEWIGYAGIRAIKGSFFNVMGLPVDKLYRKLRDF